MNRDHPSQGSPATSDESGLIDLRALMAAAQSSSRATSRPAADLTPVPVVSNLDIYPFGAPEPPAPAPAPVPAEQIAPRRFAPMKLVVPVIGAVAVAGVALGVLLGRGPQGTERPERVGAAAGAPATNGESAALPGGPAKIETAPPPEEKRAESTTPQVGKTPTLKAPATKTPGKTPPATKTPGTKTPPPTTSPCNGDLRCEMERSVKR